MEINWISRNKTGFSVQFQRIHAAETFPCARRKGRFEASLWREGGRQGGEGWEGWGLVVVDCFSYKSGITDASPYQTRGFSGLSVSITEAKEGGRVRDPSSIFCYLHPHHTQTTSSSLGFFSPPSPRQTCGGPRAALCSAPAHSAPKSISQTGIKSSKRAAGGVCTCRLYQR